MIRNAYRAKALALLGSVVLVAACSSSASPAPSAAAASAAPASAAASAAPASAATSAAASTAAGAGKTYGLFMSHMTNEFTVTLSTAAKDEATKLGVTLTVFDGNNDAATQLGQVETAISQGISAIIIEPVSVDGLVPAIQQAKDANIPVVAVDQNISKPELVTAFVGVSHVTGGQTEMDAAAKDLNGKGNIAVLLGPLGSDAELGRLKGMTTVLGQNPNIKVLFQETANWTTDQALKLMENWLQTGSTFDAIVAQNDDMALGAIKALTDAQQISKVKVYGIDATPNGLQAVQAGTLTATLDQGTAQQGTKAMDAAVDIVNGKTVPASQLLDYTVVTKANVAQFLK